MVAVITSFHLVGKPEEDDSRVAAYFSVVPQPVTAQRKRIISVALKRLKKTSQNGIDKDWKFRRNDLWR